MDAYRPPFSSQAKDVWLLLFLDFPEMIFATLSEVQNVLRQYGLLCSQKCKMHEVRWTDWCTCWGTSWFFWLELYPGVLWAPAGIQQSAPGIIVVQPAANSGKPVSRPAESERPPMKVCQTPDRTRRCICDLMLFGRVLFAASNCALERCMVISAVVVNASWSVETLGFKQVTSWVSMQSNRIPKLQNYRKMAWFFLYSIVFWLKTIYLKDVHKW